MITIHTMRVGLASEFHGVQVQDWRLSEILLISNSWNRNTRDEDLTLIDQDTHDESGVGK